MNDPIITRFLEGAKPIRGKIKGIYFFGSRAKGTARPDSDYDLLLVVSKDFSLNYKDKIYDIVMDVLLDTGRLISLKIFEAGVFQNLCRRKTPFTTHVLEEGIALG